MANSRFQTMIRSEVIKYLELQPGNIAEIAAHYRFNYHSVRNAVRSLEQEGIIRAINNGTYRNVQYTMGTDTGPNNIIPMIRTPNGQHKLQELMELRKNAKPQAVSAVLNIPMHIARILKASERLAEGRSDVALTLQSVRHEVESDAQSLRNALNVYEQLLDSDRLWNPEILKRFPNDASFSSQTVNAVYNEYFVKEKENKS